MAEFSVSAPSVHPEPEIAVCSAAQAERCAYAWSSFARSLDLDEAASKSFLVLGSCIALPNAALSWMLIPWGVPPWTALALCLAIGLVPLALPIAYLSGYVPWLVRALPLLTPGRVSHGELLAMLERAPDRAAREAVLALGRQTRPVRRWQLAPLAIRARAREQDYARLARRLREAQARAVFMHPSP